MVYPQRKFSKYPRKRLARVRARPIRRTVALARSSPEVKFLDSDLDDAVVATAGTIFSTNLIPQGVTEQTRVGRKVTLRSISWRYKITLPEIDAVASPGPSDVVRCIVYIDKQTNKALSTVIQYLELADYQSFFNLSNKSRFTTLMDRSYNMNYKTLASADASQFSSSESSVIGKFHRKLNLPIEFDSTAGAITEITSNNVVILLISQVAACALVSKIRVRFTDT